MTPPPGWYRHPRAPGPERWRDGTGWTARSRAASRPAAGAAAAAGRVFDAGADGSPFADTDRITRGIRPVGDAARGGGVGSGIQRQPR
ncbi:MULTISPECIES: DUF2510 domain-containing protein [unclassified Streptomyces]|uniref:DUF2510 domain-containing protein n=1 Tax=unclassified Streptomyces TaxID=2593676 RepID=UPI003D736840